MSGCPWESGCPGVWDVRVSVGGQVSGYLGCPGVRGRLGVRVVCGRLGVWGSGWEVGCPGVGAVRVSVGGAGQVSNLSGHDDNDGVMHVQ